MSGGGEGVEGAVDGGVGALLPLLDGGKSMGYTRARQENMASL